MMPANFYKDFSPLECDTPNNSVRVSSEAQDGEKPISVAALKANLFYAEALKEKAHNIYVKAMIYDYQAIEALNQAICKRNSDA